MKNIDSNSDKIYHQSYIIRIHEINKDGYLTIPSLISLLQETSMQHIIRLKTSVWDLKNMSLSWILLSKQLKIKRLPKRSEKITVITYPTAFDKFFAYRDYLVFDDDKKLMVTAATKWSLIDTNKRKLTRIPNFIAKLAVDNTIKNLDRPQSKIEIPNNGKNVKSSTIESYDLDWNGHVNNIILCRLMLQAILSAGQNEDNINVVNIQYKNESYLGDLLDIFLADDNSTSVVKRDGKLISAMKVEYKVS